MSTLTPQFGSLVPTQKKQLLEGNYLNFTGDAAGGDPVNNFAQQYLPEIYEAEVERYGNRTLGGFLRMVGAEMPMTSDQVIWSEQNRLHISYEGVTAPNVDSLSIPVGAGVENVVSPGSTIVATDIATGAELKCYVTASGASLSTPTGILTVKPYTQANLGVTATGDIDLASAASIKIFVYGSEYAKGTGDANRISVEPSFTQYSNSPIIIKDKYAINGSDTAQIGWVEVATESGQGGFLWYLKAESETRLRF